LYLMGLMRYDFLSFIGKYKGFFCHYGRDVLLPAADPHWELVPRLTLYMPDTQFQKPYVVLSRVVPASHRRRNCDVCIRPAKSLAA